MNTLPKSTWTHAALLLLVFMLGVGARTWEYRSMVSGLNQDEASAGVEATSLYRYGTDRNGVSFPVRFISWGSGQDALYAYILIPLIAARGLTPTIVRLPMLIFGILSLPLVYYVGRRLRGRSFGLLAMFLLAISPWHIIISRRAGDTNLFPFLFLLGIACLLTANIDNHWFVAACGVLGLSLYAYWTSYLIVPLFGLIAFPTLYMASRIRRNDLIAGSLLLVILAAPAALYTLINILGFPSIHLGPVTIPLFPSVSRINTDTALFQQTPLLHLMQNAAGFLGMIITQSDGPPDMPGSGHLYGYLYRFTFPLVLAGAVVFFRTTRDAVARRLIVAWLVSTAVLGMMISPIFLHNNALLPALILLCAASLEWLMGWNKAAFLISLAAFLAGFALFTAYYHGSEYRELVRGEYQEGLLPALEHARSSTTGPVCITDAKILEPYIFVQFAEKVAPSVGPGQLVYVDPDAQFRKVRSVGRYFFGFENCPSAEAATYVLAFTERPPVGGGAFTITRFDGFKVLVPK